MIRRWRKTILFAACSLLFAGLASVSVSQREAAVRGQITPKANIVIARKHLIAGKPVRANELEQRTLPARYLPLGTSETLDSFVGRQPAVDIPAGMDLTDRLFKQQEKPVDTRARIRRGERIIDLIATGPGQEELVMPGVKVDVLVSIESRDSGAGNTKLVLANAEVVSARPVNETTNESTHTNLTVGSRFAVSLRTTLAQAIYLANAQNFAREIRILPRPDQQKPTSTALRRRRVK